MAKGQQRSNKEARKPKKAKVKTIAANPSQKGGQRGLESLKNGYGPKIIPPRCPSRRARGKPPYRPHRWPGAAG